jgi:hypothetical protein
MCRYVYSLLLLAVILPSCVYAQQQVSVISRCGGTETVTIPSITDIDQDGMDDRLEQLLLDKFMPVIVQFSNENCPGPALNGTGDTNLVACHIYPVPQQYTRSSSYDSILIHPVALVPSRGLVPGLIWYNSLVKVNCAVLYGQDCGLLGHVADVEGFNFSIRYIGPDTLAGWMYDTLMSDWMGDTIQSISHAGTTCQQIETYPYKSLRASWGIDSVYASPNKHGNYLTISGCGSSFICNPGCGSAQIRKHVRNINLGEPNATMVTDMGNLYPAYIGNDPWSTANFLNSLGGNAGSIRDKMLLPLNSSFIVGHVLTAAEICPLYAHCFGPFEHSYSDQACAGAPYSFHGRRITQSGTYRDTLSNSNGCDSVVTLTLSVLLPDSATYQASVCSGDIYSFHGQQLSASGVYYTALTDIHGCDSTVKLMLTAHTPTPYSYSAVACDSGYSFAGIMRGSSGIYRDTVPDMYGCDSVVTLSLIIDSLQAPTWSAGPADTVLPHSHAMVLTGTHPTGGTYTGAGVHGNIFYVDSVVPGAYPIIYTYTDTLGCSRSVTRVIDVLTTGIVETDIAAGISLYPNPASDMIVAVSGIFDGREVGVTLYDMMGQIKAAPYTIHGQNVSISCGSLADGVYWIRFAVGGIYINKRFIKTNR